MKKQTAIEMLQGKKQPKKIDKIIRGILIYWVVFVSLCFVTFWVKGDEPETLVQYGLGGGAVELLVTGAIEIFRDVKFKRGGEEI